MANALEPHDDGRAVRWTFPSETMIEVPHEDPQGRYAYLWTAVGPGGEGNPLTPSDLRELADGLNAAAELLERRTVPRGDTL